MLKSAIFTFFVLVALPSAKPLLAQSGDSSSVTKPSTGRTWTLSELDTLSSHKWVWRDPSFKEVVLQTPDSLPDEQPIFKKRARVDYPQKAFDKGAEADVDVRILIDKNGKVRSAYILKDSGMDDLGFEETALEATRRNRWEPAYRHGQPMPMWVTYKNQFRLVITSAGDPVTKVDRWLWLVNDGNPLSQSLDDASATPKATPDSTGFVAFETPPKAIKLASPTYPKVAAASGVESTVRVKVLVNRNGNVKCATVAKPSDTPGLGFEEAALTAAIDGKWRPAMQEGKPVAVWVAYDISFRAGW